MTFSVVPHFLSPEDKKISVAEGKGGQTVCLSPGEKHFSHTRKGGIKLFSYKGGTNIFVSRGGQSFYTERGEQIFNVGGGGQTRK